MEIVNDTVEATYPSRAITESREFLWRLFLVYLRMHFYILLVLVNVRLRMGNLRSRRTHDLDLKFRGQPPLPIALVEQCDSDMQSQQYIRHLLRGVQMLGPTRGALVPF